MQRFWSYDIRKNNYIPTDSEPFSTFPTIVDTKNMKVWCRSCHRWENIIAFSQNVLKTECRKLYTGPFTPDNSEFSYGFDILRKDKNFYIRIQSQVVATDYRRLLETHFEVNLNKKKLYKNGKETCEREEISGLLCKEITDQIIDAMGDEYKNEFGIKPTVSSSLKGFSLVLGYMLSPFNVNFYLICQHWGLNPYDADFTSLSSGNTPNAENEMFDCLGIKPTKSVRKLYQKFPQGVIAYAAAKDLGITDVNLLMKSANPKWYAFFKYYMISFNYGDIRYGVQGALKQFAQDMLVFTNQKTLWNSLDRTVNYLVDKTVSNYYITDGMQMYQGLSEHLTQREKRELLSEGFNQYTHDFLLRRNNELNDEYRRNRVGASWKKEKDTNVTFELEKQFLDLEYKAGPATRRNSEGEIEPVPDEERYCFFVAKDSYTLKVIGSEMSNCVGYGYKSAVKERRATIVYAMHQGKYKICIEVTPQFTIRQAFGPHNTNLRDDAFEAYSEWCNEKGIVRQNAFSVHVAP